MLLIYDLEDTDEEEEEEEDERVQAERQARLGDIIGPSVTTITRDETRIQPFGPSRIRGLIRGEEVPIAEEPLTGQRFNLLRALTECAERYGVPVDPDDFDRDDLPPPPRRPRPPPLVIPPCRRPIITGEVDTTFDTIPSSPMELSPLGAPVSPLTDTPPEKFFLTQSRH